MKTQLPFFPALLLFSSLLFIISSCNVPPPTGVLFDLSGKSAVPSVTNPFLIKTSEDLAKLATLVNDETTFQLGVGVGVVATPYAASYYRLENSLDLAGYTHTPIGNCKADTDGDNIPCGDHDDIPFTGTFNGNGKTLTNLSYSNAHTGLGLFSVIDGAVISNLILSNPSMTNTTSSLYHPTGALVGVSRGKSKLANIRVIEGSISGNASVGGLVGVQSNTRITDAYTTTATSGVVAVGGLVGVISYGGTISGSSAAGNVSGSARIGGLVGYQAPGTSGYQAPDMSSILASYATGAVRGKESTGGLVGDQSGGSILASYATGAVTGLEPEPRNIGGLVGSQSGKSKILASYATGAVTGRGTISENVGGLVGVLYIGTISGSSATGHVNGDHHIGGLVGRLESGTISGSYATGNIRGASSIVGGLVGSQDGGISSIRASYATGAVRGLYYVGSLVGFQDENTSITASYATGVVRRIASEYGGLVGLSDGIVTASYWDTRTSGIRDIFSTFGRGYATSDLQVAGTATIYLTWTTPHWFFEAGQYPRLNP